MSGPRADGPAEVTVAPRNDRYGSDYEGRPEQAVTLYAKRDTPVDTTHCVPGRDVTGTGVSGAPRRPSSISGLSSRDHLGGSRGSRIASVPVCELMR